MEGVVLGKDLVSGQEVILGSQERRQGLYVIGSTGTGKTTLFLNMILQDIANGAGVCILAPHAGLVQQILSRIPSVRKGDVWLLDPLDQDYPFGLNLFECSDPKDPILVSRISGQVVHIFKKIWGIGAVQQSWGPLLEDLLSNIALTLIENQGYTMAEIPLLLESESFRRKLTSGLKNFPVKQFWELTYNRMSERDQREYSSSTLNKVRSFLRNPIVYNIVGQRKTTIDFLKAMDCGMILLVPLPLALSDDAVISLLGSVMAAQIVNAMYQRREDESREFFFYADEYQRFETQDFPVLLAEGRKFGIATTIAHQFRDQLSFENKGATLNVGNLIIFRVSGKDAQDLAGEFDCTPPPPAVSSQRPIRSFSPNPLNDLLHNSHTNKNVNEIITRTIRPLFQMLQKPLDNWGQLNDAFRFDGISTSSDLSHALYTYNHLYLQTGINHINDFLFQVMNGSIKVWSLETATWFELIITDLRGYLHFCTCTTGGSWAESARNKPIPPASLIALRKFLINRYAPVDSETAHKRILRTAEEYYQSEDYQTYLDFITARYDAAMEDPGLTEYRSQEHASDLAEKIAKFECGNVTSFISDLTDLARALGDEPVMVDTHQYEPVLERPRTYDDVKNEIASTLVSQPNFKARYKILQGNSHVEGTLSTNPSGSFDSSTSLSSIKESSRRQVAPRHRSEVEAEIRRRQEDQDEPPRISRRTRL